MNTTNPPPELAQALDAPYPLSAEQIRFYQTEGYIKLKDVLTPGVLEFYGREISRLVDQRNTQTLPLEQRNTYQKAFLQITNLWVHSELVRQFAFSKRLARIASELMNCRGVRMYHDQALYKEAGGGITPWHADQFYWPLDTDNTTTVWIPLQATDKQLGPLSFSARSQRFQKGRDLAISDDSEEKLRDYLNEQHFSYVEEPFALGEVSFHSGWTFHRAAANHSDRPRRVMTVIYFDIDARVSQPKSKSQEADLAGWLPGCRPGEPAASPLNPVLYCR